MACLTAKGKVRRRGRRRWQRGGAAEEKESIDDGGGAKAAEEGDQSAVCAPHQGTQVPRDGASQAAGKGAPSPRGSICALKGIKQGLQKPCIALPLSNTRVSGNPAKSIKTVLASRVCHTCATEVSGHAMASRGLCD